MLEQSQGQRTRAQKIVATLMDRVTPDKADRLAAGRAKQLPGMLLRHGLLQVVAFLGLSSEKNGKPDRSGEELLSLLEEGVQVLLDDAPAPDRGAEQGKVRMLTLGHLAKLDAGRLLLLQELSIEVAHWIERVVEARKSEKKGP